MIIDHLDNIHFYAPLLPNLEKGLQAIREEKEKAGGEIPAGRYDFDGGFFKVERSKTKAFSDGTYEAHKNFIDVQIIEEGSEEIAWAMLEELTESIPYNAEKDAARYTGDFSHQMKIKKGMFWAAFPWDGHRPGAHSKEEQNYAKIILKLPFKE